MFTKDKKPDMTKRPPERRKAPENRADPRVQRREARPAAENQAAPQRRRPPASGREDPRRRTEAAGRPAENRKSGRAAVPGKTRRPEERRAAGADQKQARPAAGRPERRKVPAAPGAGKAQPEQKASRQAQMDPEIAARLAAEQEAEHRENLTAEEILRELQPETSGEAEDKVFEIRQAPRKMPTTSRTAGAKKPQPKENPKGRKANAVRQPPQGTGYHRSTPKQKKTLRDYFIKPGSKYYKDPEQQAAAARARQAFREDKKERLRKLAAKLDTPAIVYTEPKPFNRNRLLIQLVSVLAVASAFVMALSIFFKVEYITVSGTETYSPHVIQEASGIHVGDNLLTFGRARASGLITANLPYVNSVRIGIKLPNTVNIDVEEADIAYSIKSGDGDWWLITSEGKVVKQIPGSTARNYTQVLGVLADKPEEGQPVMAVEAVSEEEAAEQEKKEDQKEEKKEEGSKLEPPVAVSGAMRLSSALRILVALEENDIVGDAATVNVEDVEKIELWYGQRYQVNLGSSEQLEYKVACMYDAILQMSDYQTGMLDVSFEKKKDQVIYTPFV